jgi:hypothetical protein
MLAQHPNFVNPGSLWAAASVTKQWRQKLLLARIDISGPSILQKFFPENYGGRRAELKDAVPPFLHARRLGPHFQDFTNPNCPPNVETGMLDINQNQNLGDHIAVI